MTLRSAEISQELQLAVAEAAEQQRPLALAGSGSKAFLQVGSEGAPFDVRGHRGVVNYEPRELVITARCGTRLLELEALLAGEGQMLAFEPPAFGPQATLGGTVACGLSGPRRPYAGSVRDFVLGCTMINGRGQLLRFGGEVMKNVAGYDVSRLMVGAMGTLGLLLDMSMKVLPLPELECTLIQDLPEAQAIELANRLAGRPVPLSGACYDGLRLYLRFSGDAQGVEAACRRVGGDRLSESEVFWQRLREHRHPFFDTDQPLWRVAVAPATPPLGLSGKQLIDWGGAQRWLISDAAPHTIQERAREHGGHARLFRSTAPGHASLAPLNPSLLPLHRQLKHAFDPHGILNPGRLHPEF